MYHVWPRQTEQKKLRFSRQRRRSRRAHLPINNRHVNTVKLPLVQARANFSGKFSLASCIELRNRIPNKLRFGLLLFEIMSHHFFLQFCLKYNGVCCPEPNSTKCCFFSLIEYLKQSSNVLTLPWSWKFIIFMETGIQMAYL